LFVERRVSQDQRGEKRIKLVPPDRMSDFLISLLITAAPMIVLIVVIMSTVGRGGASLWWLTLVLWVFVILICAGFAIADKRKIAQGILVGIAIGLAGLVLSCATVLR
jgi:hypothetical protein